MSFLIKVVNAEYDEIKDVNGSNKRQYIIEKLVHDTSKRKAKYKAFDKKFFKLPSYLRRSAITAARPSSAFKMKLNAFSLCIHRLHDMLQCVLAVEACQKGLCYRCHYLYF